MKNLAALAVLVLAVPMAAIGQTVKDPEIEQRVRALEAQVQALMAEIATLKAARVAEPTPAPTPSPGAAPESPSALAAAPTGGEEHHDGPLPVYGGTSSKALNPDIGMIGNFLGAMGSSGAGSGSIAPSRR